jgi:hypothetical protein
MLPDIRAVVAAMLAAIGLLMISFALVASYRVAQEHQSGSLQADLAKRGRDALPVKSGERQIPIIETPGPHVLAPAETAPIVTVAAPLAEPEAASPAPVAAMPPQGEILPPPAEPPVGGPLAEPPAVAPVSSRNAAADNPSLIDSRALQRAAAEKARRARAARLARERKAAARRAAQVRRAKEKASAAQFGNSFGGTFTVPGQ